MKWPWGKRVVIDEQGVRAVLPDEWPVEFWVCCRVDEPWTWRVLPGQQIGACATCHDAIIYLVSAKSPTDPAVRKICKRCAERLALDDANTGTRSTRA